MSMLNQGGFSLVEVIVVVAVSALLLATVVIYSRSGDMQIILFREQYKMMGVISKAKSAALSTLADANPACGYGVHFDLTHPDPYGADVPDSYLLFKDLVGASGKCDTADRVYGGDAERVDGPFYLPARVTFGGIPLSDIVFIPPDPRTVISKGNQILDRAEITLRPTGGIEGEAKIILTNAGQISSE